MENGQLDKELISVIVPVYNTKSYLRKCVESIQKQTYANLEIILVDDGSTDGSDELCDQLSKEDERICVIHQINQGLSAARNSGLKIAKGEFIGFIDSDDYIYHGMYQKLMETMLLNNADIAVGGIVMTCDEEYFKDAIYQVWNEKIYDKEQAVMQLFDKYTDAVSACNKLYRKEMFQQITYPIGKKHEDEYVTYRLLYVANKVVFIAEKMYAYVQRDGSIVHTPSEQSLLDKIEAYKQVMEYCKENAMSQAYACAVCRYLDFRREYYEVCKKYKRDDVKGLRKELLQVSFYYNREVRFDKKNWFKMMLFVVSPYLFYFFRDINAKR